MCLSFKDRAMKHLRDAGVGVHMYCQHRIQYRLDSQRIVGYKMTATLCVYTLLNVFVPRSSAFAI